MSRATVGVATVAAAGQLLWRGDTYAAPTTGYVTGDQVAVLVEDGRLTVLGKANAPAGGGGISEADADARYVNVSGDTMSGDLTVPSVSVNRPAATSDAIMTFVREGQQVGWLGNPAWDKPNVYLMGPGQLSLVREGGARLDVRESDILVSKGIESSGTSADSPNALLKRSEGDARWGGAAALPARLGAASQMVTDWDAARENGFYTSAHDAAHCPVATKAGEWRPWVGVVVNHNLDWVTQNAWRIQNDDGGYSTAPQVWARRRAGDTQTWQPWYLTNPPRYVRPIADALPDPATVPEGTTWVRYT